MALIFVKVIQVGPSISTHFLVVTTQASLWMKTALWNVQSRGCLSCHRVHREGQIWPNTESTQSDCLVYGWPQKQSQSTEIFLGEHAARPPWCVRVYYAHTIISAPPSQVPSTTTGEVCTYCKGALQHIRCLHSALDEKHDQIQIHNSSMAIFRPASWVPLYHLAST